LNLISIFMFYLCVEMGGVSGRSGVRTAPRNRFMDLLKPIRRGRLFFVFVC
jgi:hypothetical protein